MKSVRTTVLSLAMAGAATASNLWAQGLAPLPSSAYPVYSTAYAQRDDVRDVGPIDDEPIENGRSIVRPRDERNGRGDLEYPGQPDLLREDHGAPVNGNGNGRVNGDHVAGPYADAMNSPWCDDCTSEIPNCCPRWFGSAAGLVMGRDNSDKFWTSYLQPTNENQIMNSKDAELDWGGGVDLRLGRCFGCNNAWELGYFGVWGMNGESAVRNSGDLIGTPLDVTNGAPTLDGVAAADFFDNARAHKIVRESEIHSVELNVLGNHLACGPGMGCGSPVNVSWLAGFRYFRFDDEFSFGALQGDVGAGVVDPARDWDTDGGIYAAYLNADVENNLYGFQIGARADYQPSCKWAMFLAPKIGLYGNHIESDTSFTRGDGFSEWELSAEKNDVSFLCQVDLGGTYYLSDRCSLFGGYRAVAITGVALSDEQFPQYLADTAGFEEIKSNGSVIFHGAFAGLEYRF